MVLGKVNGDVDFMKPRARYKPLNVALSPAMKWRRLKVSHQSDGIILQIVAGDSRLDIVYPDFHYLCPSIIDGHSCL
jgi:hypothetical protein